MPVQVKTAFYFVGISRLKIDLAAVRTVLILSRTYLQSLLHRAQAEGGRCAAGWGGCGGEGIRAVTPVDLP